jgi:NAD(P)-dependent dehydrogenase (short-subunit alcohol dehydrogenase family)
MAHAVTNQFKRRQRALPDQGRPPRNARPARKFGAKVALIAGGDSGIGRAVAIAFAKAGADIAIIYLNEHRRAEETRQAILRENVRCDLLAGDVASQEFCRNAVKRVMAARGRLDILVNNAAEQGDRTFRTNLLGMFCLTKAAMPHLPAGGTIINTTAVTAWRDSAHLIDDAATTETIVSFTRSIARAVADRRIRVNAVTPGAAPLEEIAPSYVLAAQDGPFVTGQVLQARTGEAAA